MKVMPKNKKKSKSLVTHKMLFLLAATIATISATITLVAAQGTNELSNGLIGVGVGLAMGLAGLGAARRRKHG